MNLAIWIFLGFLIALSCGPVTGGGVSRVNEKQLAKFQQRVGLPMPDSLRQSVLGRIAGLERCTVAGGMVGLVLAAVGSLFLGGSERLAGPVILSSVALSAGVGGAVWVTRSLRRDHSESPKVARSVATRLSDYVPSGERFSARLGPILAGLSGILGVTLLLFIPREHWLTGWMVAVPVLITLSLVVTVATALLSRRLLDLGQRASSDVELAWDDVVRAQALRGLWMNVTALAAIAVGASFAMVGDTVIRPEARAGAEDLTFTVGMVAFALGVIFLLVLLLPVIRDRTGVTGIRHVVRTLWSTAAFTQRDATADSEEAQTL